MITLGKRSVLRPFRVVYCATLVIMLTLGMTLPVLPREARAEENGFFLQIVEPMGFVYGSSSYSELGYPFNNDSSIKNAYNTVIKRVLYEYLQQVADDDGYIWVKRDGNGYRLDLPELRTQVDSSSEAKLSRNGSNAPFTYTLHVNATTLRSKGFEDNGVQATLCASFVPDKQLSISTSYSDRPFVESNFTELRGLEEKWSNTITFSSISFDLYDFVTLERDKDGSIQTHILYPYTAEVSRTGSRANSKPYFDESAWRWDPNLTWDDLNLTRTISNEDIFTCRLWKDLVVEVDPPDVAGEIGKFAIPVFIVTGAAVAGTKLFGKLRGRRKGGSGDDSGEDPDDDPKPPTRYRMVVSKDFGNKLVPGGKPRTVRAHIEEWRDLGNGIEAPRKNEEMTRSIATTGKQGLQVTSTAIRDGEKVVGVSVPKTEGPPGQYLQPLGAEPVLPILDLSYTGRGGTFTTRIKFQLADEPAIVFLDPWTGEEYARDAADADLLVGDGKDTPLRFAVTGFTGEPRITIEPSAADVSEEHERYDDPKRPRDYVYKASLSTSHVFDSPYGTLPVEREYRIIAESDWEFSEATVRAKLWPAGFFFDTREVPEGWVQKDHIAVDTSPIEGEKGTDQLESMPELRVATGVGIRDERGAVVIDHPTLPEGETFFRLHPKEGDAGSELLLNRDSPRFWYDLSLRNDPLDANIDARLGSLVLVPMFPIVTKEKGTRFPCSCRLVYRRNGKRTWGSIDLTLSGLSKEVAEGDSFEKDGKTIARADLVKAINRLLAGRQYHDIARIRSIYEQHGIPARSLLEKLGSPEELSASGRSAEALMREVNQTASTRRLYLIYRELHWASRIYCEEKDGMELITGHTVSWRTVGEWYNKLYLTTMAIRYANNVAFSLWCKLAFKSKAEYVEPLLTPLKDYALKWFELLGEMTAIEAVSGEDLTPQESTRMVRLYDQMQPEAFFSLSNIFAELVVPAIENEFIGACSSAITKNGVSSLVNSKGKVIAVVGALGTIVTLIFAKNIIKKSKEAELEGRPAIEVDLWGALRATMADITIGTFRVVIAVVFTMLMKRVWGDAAKTLGVQKEAPDPMSEAKITIDETNLEGKAAGLIIRAYLKLGGMAEGYVLYPAVRHYHAGHSVTLSELLAEMDASEGYDLMKTVFESSATECASLSRELSGDSFDEWVRGLGNVDVLVMREDGTTMPTTIPVLAYMIMCVDNLLKKTGVESLECMRVNYEKTLPEKCRYMTRDERIALMESVEAYGEVRFLSGETRSGRGEDFQNPGVRVVPSPIIGGVTVIGVDNNVYRS